MYSVDAPSVNGNPTVNGNLTSSVHFREECEDRFYGYYDSVELANGTPLSPEEVEAYLRKIEPDFRAAVRRRHVREIADGLRLFAVEGHALEVRALGGKPTRCKAFDAADVAA